MGSPWIDARRLSAYLKRRAISGVHIETADFTPRADIYKNHRCHGIRITVVDRSVPNTPFLGIEIIGALHRLYPHIFQIDDTRGLVGSEAVLAAMKNGENPGKIELSWRRSLNEFVTLREKYLLYR